MLEVLDDFLWVLRRDGIAISTPEAIDVARAAEAVGFSDRAVLREAIACIVADTKVARTRVHRLFDDFFTPKEPKAGDFWQRLSELGFRPIEIDALRELFEELGGARGSSELWALLGGGRALDRLLASPDVQRLVSEITSPLTMGFYLHRVLEEAGMTSARSALSLARERLTEAFGAARSEVLTDLLSRELERTETEVRDQIEDRLRKRAATGESEALLMRPFGSLSEAEADEVRWAVRRFAERLRGAARVRERHGRRGRIDPHRTVRRSMATFGVPFRAVRRDHRRDKPKLLVLCDVSDSVRPAARFMLEFVHAVKELFAGTRSFVFVSEVGELTSLLARSDVGHALSEAASSLVNVQDLSNYARVFATFEDRYADALDRRTTLVILGDGRTNYRPPGLEELGRIRERVRSVLWLCPEPRAGWGTGDSAIPLYTDKVDKVLEAACAADLERSARELVARR
jgi:uncharacterized protein with von Willebrand factor type A (vWA) domain